MWELFSSKCEHKLNLKIFFKDWMVSSIEQLLNITGVYSFHLKLQLALSISPLVPKQTFISQIVSYRNRLVWHFPENYVKSQLSYFIALNLKPLLFEILYSSWLICNFNHGTENCERALLPVCQALYTKHWNVNLIAIILAHYSREIIKKKYVMKNV